MRLVTRFAPSPTGLLHVGNAYSALYCQRWAAANDAELLLRIEDIDHTRCRDHWIDQMLDDLAWLGLDWPQPVRRQSRHLEDYHRAIRQLQARQLIYPCFCTRKQIQQELAAMASAPQRGDPHHHYSGHCRHIDRAERERRMQAEPFAWRLDAKRVMQQLPAPLFWRDDQGNRHAATLHDDIVIGRKDIAVSYHLCVVVDDAIQGVTHVIRGEDLRESTPIHRILQQLLNLPTPIYIHHPLVCDSSGQRLAKRNNGTTLKSLRQQGIRAANLQAHLFAQPNPTWPPDANS